MGNNEDKKSKVAVAEMIKLYRGLLVSMESIAERTEAVLAEARKTLERLETEVDES